MYLVTTIVMRKLPTKVARQLLLSIKSNINERKERSKRKIRKNLLSYPDFTRCIRDSNSMAWPGKVSISTVSSRDHSSGWLVPSFPTINDLEWLITQTTQFKIKSRPRREEPRQIKNRNGKYARLSESRPSRKLRRSREKVAQAP